MSRVDCTIILTPLQAELVPISLETGDQSSASLHVISSSSPEKILSSQKLFFATEVLAINKNM